MKLINYSSIRFNSTAAKLGFPCKTMGRTAIHKEMKVIFKEPFYNPFLLVP